MYSDVSSQPNFPEMEREILELWDQRDIFARSVEQNREGVPFTFYDGPPFATGLPHYGHVMVGMLKDTVQRYYTMKGRYVPRRFGWDCHGLPVEYETEKMLGIFGKKAIESYGVRQFNEACRSIVLKYTREWRSTVRRSGRWVDFSNEYRTMDLDYMETIWWVVKRLWDKGLLLQGHYILPYCPRCSTILSNHDVALGGYKDIYDPAVTVRFPLEPTDRIPESGQGRVSLLAWTTTPWTLPMNLGLALHPEIEYALAADPGSEGDYVILAKAKADEFLGEEIPILRGFPGSELGGLRYRALLPYFAPLAEQGAFRTHNAEFVTAEEGSGIVHCASGFGEDDYWVLSQAGVPVVTPIDEECRYTEAVPDFSGIFVRDANKAVIEKLKETGLIFKRDQILHSYPHCWRCESPLIYRAIHSWFVDVESLKEKLLRANAQIRWVPEHLKEGRFGNWLRNARNWAISRNRYWGNPIPIWTCGNGHQICLGSRAELEERIGQPVDDLHKDTIDLFQFDCPECGAAGQRVLMSRVPEVLDCWFESGAMPYAQNHYPFERREWFEKNFPADFINESLDQTRGWFYTLTVLSVALFDKPPFRNCVVSGMILAEDGKKMSKSLRNYTPPDEIMDLWGADALRLYLMSGGVVKGEPTRFSDQGVRNTIRTVILPLWNAYSFFVTYANADRIFPEVGPEKPENPLDCWILSELETLSDNFGSAMETFFLARAVQSLLHFIDLLNNWYIRRSRRRFWKSGCDQDKEDAYATLWYVLQRLVRVAAPLTPFLSEKIYLGLHREEGEKPEDSVHLTRFPEVIPQNRRPELEQRMALARRCVSLGRSLRAQYQIRNRLPLAEAWIVTRDPGERALLEGLTEMIREELNVKKLRLDQREEELVSYQAKANFRILGKKVGRDMKPLAAAVEQLDSAAVARILNGESLMISFPGKDIQEFPLSADEIEVRRLEREGFHVLNEGSLTVALQVEVSPELYAEGLVRDLIRLIQAMRKSADLQISQRIVLTIAGSPLVSDAVKQYENFLLQETQAVAWYPRALRPEEPDYLEIGDGAERVCLSFEFAD